MVYRDWLCELSTEVQSSVRDLCQKRRSEMSQQITHLYDLAQREPRGDFLAALELAAEQQMYGAEYVQALLSSPERTAPSFSAPLTELNSVLVIPAQHEVERDLAHYERYVANREGMLQMVQQERGRMA